MLLIALLGWSPLCGALRLNPIATTRGAVSVVASAASASAAVPAAPAHRLEVDLGRGLSVAIVVPELADEPDDAAVEQLSDVELVASYGHLLGAGDIVWPAGLALARLLRHCPSFTRDKKVLELGAGLGAVGLCAALSGASSVLLTDYDEDVLRNAAAGAAANGCADSVRVRRLDWSDAAAATRDLFSRDDEDSAEKFELVLGADVLYDRANAVHIAALLPSLLAEEDARALIADQTQWPWREVFEAECAAVGLSVDQQPLPGPENVVLLSVTRA